eukprot:9388126-Alexandrium_andersonii.AAC.1
MSEAPAPSTPNNRPSTTFNTPDRNIRASPYPSPGSRSDPGGGGGPAGNGARVGEAEETRRIAAVAVP